MITIFITLLIGVLYIQIVFLICSIIIYGRFISNKKLSTILKDVDIKNDCNINRYSKNIFYIKDYPFISKTSNLSLFTNYHIDEMGLVPIWSKYNKELKKIHKYLKNN